MTACFVKGITSKHPKSVIVSSVQSTHNGLYKGPYVLGMFYNQLAVDI